MASEVRKFGNVEIRLAGRQGPGMFARQDFPADEVIRDRQIVRKLTSEKPIMSGERSDHVTVIDGELFLVGEPDCYLNHSCDPNAFLAYPETGVQLVARRDIAAGEQITLDYLINNAGGDSWECYCGADRCRGQTGVSFFELPSEFQQEYLPLLADWFCKSHVGPITEIRKMIGQSEGE